jgi:putative transcriptional regulator
VGGDVTAKVGNHIRRLRFEQGELTQEELARRVGITRQTVISLEAGRYAPSLELAFRIAQAFSVGIEKVFFWRDSSPQQEGRPPATRPRG